MVIALNIALWTFSIILCLASADQVQHVKDYLAVRGFTGSLHPLGSRHYEQYRRVQNGACNRVLFPLVIIRPRSTRDVAIGVKAAEAARLPISVRSGGHGYTCNNLKNGSLHFDMRAINHVSVVSRGYGQVR